MPKANKIQTGIIIDESVQYSFAELCEICNVKGDLVIEMVHYGMLDPRGKSTKSWHFSAKELQRVKRALRLQRDFELNLSGMALAVELIEQMSLLQAQLDELENQLNMFHTDFHH